MVSKEKVLVQVVPEGVNFSEVGQKVEGVLKKVEEDVGQYGSRAYYLRNGNKTQIVYGTTVLDRLMNLIDVEDEIVIKFVKTEESAKGKNPTKIFEVHRMETPESSPSLGGDVK